jgi:DNA-binding NarL/FixJ family response regulator
LGVTPPAQLLHAIRVAADGEALLSPSITRRLIEAFAQTPVAHERTELDLTDRETDVLRLLARGLSNADIARQLQIGQATVKTYVSRLLTKLNVSTRVHLVIRAYESGLAG